jgi:hypothetical protein
MAACLLFPVAGLLMMGPTDQFEPMRQGQNEAQAEKIVLRSYSHRTGEARNQDLLSRAS